ncbi:hypothetical protein [Pelagibacterium halotolerans]|uniref:hypothetical protein n=1 Tax=Pelagibacterium halotolerans TaxID=531813 RepID=UPI003850B11E
MLILAVAMVPSMAAGQVSPAPQPDNAGIALTSVQFGGGEIFLVPAWQGDAIAPGETSGEETQRLLGGFSFGANLISRIGDIGEAPVYVEWMGSVLLGVGRSIDRTAYSGNEELLVTGVSAPTSGTVDLVIGAGTATATGTVSLTDSTGDTGSVSGSASSPPGNNATAQYSVTTTETGAVGLALTTDGSGPEAAGFGVVADADGFALVGVGNLENAEVTSSIRETLLMASQKVMFSSPFRFDDGWTVTPKFGPAYNLIARSVHQETLIDVQEAEGLGDVIPMFGLEHDDDLVAHYAGGIIGASLSGPVAEGWRFSVGTEVGVSGYWADYDGAAAAILPGAGRVTLPDTSQAVSGMTLYNRVSGGLTYLDPDGFTVNLGVHVERLGDVPYIQTTPVNTADADFNAGNTEAEYSASGETYYERSIATGPMWNVGATISLTNRF